MVDDIPVPGTVSQSPTVPRQIIAHVTLDFYDALKRLADGDRITKLEWADKTIYCELRQVKNPESGLPVDVAMIHNGGWHQWTISYGDMVGTDWVIV